MFKIKEKGAKHGYIADYTLGIYLSGIIVLILNTLSIIATLHIPYEAHTLYPEIMMDLLFGGVVGVILALLFLLVRTKIVYFVFLSFLIIGLISKIFLLQWLWTMTGRAGGGIAFGIGLPFLLIIYLTLKYKSVFIPVDKLVINQKNSLISDEIDKKGRE